MMQSSSFSMNAITPEQDAETDLHWESPNIALEALQAMGGKVLRFCEILSCAFRETVFLFVGIMALLTDHNERVLSFKCHSLLGAEQLP